MAPHWQCIYLTTCHCCRGQPSEIEWEQEFVWVALYKVVCYMWSEIYWSSRYLFAFLPLAVSADDGIEEIQGGVLLKCLQTRTGIKFVLTWVQCRQLCQWGTCVVLYLIFCCFLSQCWAGDSWFRFGARWDLCAIFRMCTGEFEDLHKGLWYVILNHALSFNIKLLSCNNKRKQIQKDPFY